MIINHDSVKRLKECYPTGTRIELCGMKDPYCPVPSGTKGTVDMVDDVGTIHVTWDNGRTLGVIPGEDSFHTIRQEPEITTMKLYMPLSVTTFERDEYGDICNIPHELDNQSLIALRDNILAAIKYNELPEEAEHGLMKWYHKNDAVSDKVISMRPTVEEIDGQLIGAMECRVKGGLIGDELDI